MKNSKLIAKPPARATLCLFLFALCCFAIQETLDAQLQPLKPSYLLLKNGGLMRGQITRTSTGFEVISGRGSRYRMPNAQVAGYYGTIEEVFGHKFLIAKKRNQISAYSELVYWCVEEELISEARQVVAHMPKTPASRQAFVSNRSGDGAGKTDAARLSQYIDSAQHRINLRRQKASMPTQNAGLQPAQKRTQGVGRVPSQPGASGEVRPVSWDSDVESTNLLQPREKKKYLPTLAEIEAATKDMPKNTNRLFRSLQVKLATGCLAAQCHSQTTDSFQVTHTRRGQKVGWRTTQKNIFFVLQFADRKDPDKSILLEKMANRHATQSQAAFPKDSKAYQMMRMWLYLVTDNEPLYRQKQFIEANQKTTQSPGEKSNSSPGQDGQGNSESTNKTVDPLTLNPPDPAQLLKTEKTLAKDPFDPDIFNRKHHPNRK